MLSAAIPINGVKMSRTAKKYDVPAITTTYVWRVALCCEPIDKYLELLVLCTEQIPGEKFHKAIEETFLVYVMRGKVPADMPTELSEYVVKMSSNMGLAAGAVEQNANHGVSIGTLNNGVPVLVNPERLSVLAGLGTDAVKIEEAKANRSEKARERSIQERKTRESEHAERKGPLYDVLMETAAKMAVDGDMSAVDETTLQQAVAAVQVTNPSVFSPSPPETPEERVKAVAEIRKKLNLPEPLFSEKECADFAALGIAVNPRTGEAKLIEQLFVLDVESDD
jgi:hypothetical protein